MPKILLTRRAIIETIVFVALIIVILMFGIQNYGVSGISMEPGLTNGEHVIVIQSHGFYNPHRGDVIVFHNPQNSNEDLVKRVIGLPGDTITTDISHLWVNNTLLNESAYVNAPPNTPLNPSASTWHIPPNEYFVLGDNRPVSYDSRYFGPIPKDDIIGYAWFVLWPIHPIDTHSNVFANVKNP